MDFLVFIFFLLLYNVHTSCFIIYSCSVQLKPFGVFKGNVDNVIFIGEYRQISWSKAKLTNYFFLYATREGQKVQCLRVAKDLCMKDILSWFLKLLKCQGISLNSPLLTYQGWEVEEFQTILQFKPLSLFLLHDGTVPEQLANHKGKLVECQVCNQAWNKLEKKKCKHAHLFKGAFPKSFARNMDRHQTPWGCPNRKQQVPPVPSLQLQQGQQSLTR